MHYGSKGWYVKELKNLGVRKHPTTAQPIGRVKGTELANIYRSITEKE